jgi:hypothetical protein
MRGSVLPLRICLGLFVWAIKKFPRHSKRRGTQSSGILGIMPRHAYPTCDASPVTIRGHTPYIRLIASIQFEVSQEFWGVSAMSTPNLSSARREPPRGSLVAWTDAGYSAIASVDLARVHKLSFGRSALRQ